MPMILRRVLDHLPHLSGRSGELYVRSTWHRPTPFEQWRTHMPFRPAPTLRKNHFTARLRLQRWGRLVLAAALVVATLWLIVESARGLALL